VLRYYDMKTNARTMSALATETYHVYNRGTEKRRIFMNDADRLRFIHDLWEFNDVEQVDSNSTKGVRRDRKKDVPLLNGTECTEVQPPYILRGEVGRAKQKLVHIHAYCLMDNHYHLMLSPAVEDGVSLFMKKLAGGYTMYFNEKYNRTGALFQGRYKRKVVKSEGQYLHLPLYIHLNPLDVHFPEWRTGGIKRGDRARAHAYLLEYRWSSHKDYMRIKNFASVIHMDTLNRVFKLQGGYTNVMQDGLAFFDSGSVKPIQLEKDEV
jgi:putative transposase